MQNHHTIYIYACNNHCQKSYPINDRTNGFSEISIYILSITVRSLNLTTKECRTAISNRFEMQFYYNRH